MCFDILHSYCSIYVAFGKSCMLEIYSVTMVVKCEFYLVVVCVMFAFTFL